MPFFPVNTANRSEGRDLVIKIRSTLPTAVLFGIQRLRLRRSLYSKEISGTLHSGGWLWSSRKRRWSTFWIVLVTKMTGYLHSGHQRISSKACTSTLQMTASYFEVQRHRDVWNSSFEWLNLDCGGESCNFPTQALGDICGVGLFSTTILY